MTEAVDRRRLMQDLAAVLGPAGWQVEAGGRARDGLDRFGVTPLGLARPASTEAVAEVVRICRAARVAVVPQGGNTGLCGGAVAGGQAVLLSLERMAAISPPIPGHVVVEAGVVLARLHAALQGTGQAFPLHLGAEGSAQIGGLIGTNAGGSQAFRHGMMGDLVLGLEVVLPDGRIWNGMRAVQKDNAGYQLRRLFCGAEGTLGIVTRAVLRLVPEPRRRATALLALPDVAALVRFAPVLQAEAGDVLSAAEFFPDAGLALALTHLPGLAFPLQSRAGVYLLVELATASTRIDLDEILAALTEAGLGAGLITDGALAQNEAQREAFWRLRDAMPEAQRRAGPQLKHDISVPPGRIAEFLAQAGAACEATQNGMRINPFGHLGDGNIHFNLSPPEGQGFALDAPELGARIAGIAEAMGGSLAAEHGLGRAKIALADRLRSRAEREAMAAIKRALDPSGGMNPGVLLAPDRKEKIS